MAYLLVTLTYLYIGVLVFASFPSPPLPKDCIEQVRPGTLRGVRPALRSVRDADQ